jgi:hypothetical protein
VADRAQEAARRARQAAEHAREAAHEARSLPTNPPTHALVETRRERAG